VAAVAVAAVPFTLRPADDGDLEFLRSLYASTRAEEVALTGWPEAEQRAFLRMQFDAQHRHYHAHYPDGEYSIVCCDQQAVGRWYRHRGRDEIRIMDIALLPEWRCRGIGRALMVDAIAESERTATPLGLHVEHHNPARAWYGRLGFVPVEEAGPYLRMMRPVRADIRLVV
jgi:ribosomal protein S18 acetylase RimI-like enzyme